MAIDADPRLVDALYRGVDDPAEFERALTILSDSFACRSAALISLDATAPATNVVRSIVSKPGSCCSSRPAPPRLSIGACGPSQNAPTAFPSIAADARSRQVPMRASDSVPCWKRSLAGAPVEL